MGCISSKKEFEDLYPNVFQVMNVDEHGNHINSGQLEITDCDLVLYQQGRSPIKWPLRTLRRYGFDAEHFSFESGRRCPTGPGIYAFRCRRAEQLFNLLQSRIQTRNNGESEPVDALNNFSTTGPSRDSLYLEPAPLRRSVPGSRFSSQNDGMTRLSSVGSTSGSVGPLSPQSITSAPLPLPLDSVPLIPPLPTSRPLSQSLYANEDVIAAVSQDFEETNNNKTFDDPVSPTSEHSYLNSAVLDSLQRENLSNLSSHTMTEETSSPSHDNNHLYMNIIPGTDKVAPIVLPQPSGNPLTLKKETPEDSCPNYANFDADLGSPQRTTPALKNLNYIVLDLEPTGDLPKSPTASLPPEIPRKPTGGYAAIDFKKTVALSHSVKPNYDTDSESSRKTRHSSNINNVLPQERHSSSVSD